MKIIYSQLIRDLIVKKNSEFYTVEVKTARTYKEKDSTYIRFDISQWKHNKNRLRESYKGKVDFIASANQNTLKSYILPVNLLPKTDAKLKLDRRKDMRQMHHGTIWAEDYEFSKVDDIVKDFKNMKKQEELNRKINQEIEKMLTYSDNYTGYSKEKKVKLNFHAKNVINDLKRRFQ